MTKPWQKMTDDEYLNYCIKLQEQMANAAEGAEMDRMELAHKILCDTKYPYIAAPTLLQALQCYIDSDDVGARIGTEVYKQAKEAIRIAKESL